MRRVTALYRIDMGYFCCGVEILVSEDGKNATVIDAAPIMRWAIGKDWSVVLHWVHRKRGTYELVSRKEYHGK